MTNNSRRFKWSALFAGMADPLNAAKSFVLFFWMGILVVIFLSLAWGGLTLWSKFAPKPTPDVVTAETANIDKSNKTVTNLPFSFHFGSSQKEK